MAKDYDNSLKYAEKNCNIKTRRCVFCSKMVSVDKLETQKTCSKCYPESKGKKRCQRCLIRRPVSCFSKNKLTSDNYLNQCKFCVKESRLIST